MGLPDDHPLMRRLHAEAVPALAAALRAAAPGDETDLAACGLGAAVYGLREPAAAALAAESDMLPLLVGIIASPPPASYGDEHENALDGALLALMGFTCGGKRPAAVARCAAAAAAGAADALRRLLADDASGSWNSDQMRKFKAEEALEGLEVYGY